MQTHVPGFQITFKSVICYFPSLSSLFFLSPVSHTHQWPIYQVWRWFLMAKSKHMPLQVFIYFLCATCLWKWCRDLYNSCSSLQSIFTCPDSFFLSFFIFCVIILWLFFIKPASCGAIIFRVFFFLFSLLRMLSHSLCPRGKGRKSLMMSLKNSFCTNLRWAELEKKSWSLVFTYWYS